MLDNGTKRHIDTARQILVGKVPDPKAQVEQITNALIYKFMDDMDQQSVQIGGVPKFFTGEFEKYAWPKLLDKSLSGQERLERYSEALVRMSENANLPPLFREIFKDAFLPYRDSGTLNLFLKEIDSFTYDHSERLGDAYEYLLSVLGSQGDAGQFRTPRHIIDFMVQVMQPGLTDTILDPACGTAGFLISAYKYIVDHNPEMTPDQKETLTKNITGYDISPDMVRLSQVNMYLHRFPNPRITEYDTLTYEEHWDERFDLIMANPPFMTPKGGIRPHTRFAVQANRSEVLFVDYIAEHLNPQGRAAVIVPEGIIFQSSNAYKELRRMLVEDRFLYAVVSLPAGVFNPYSGVKTSILLLDRTLARQTEEVLFVGVGADGYGLGAQRSPVEANDLPEALRIIRVFQQEPGAELPPSPLAHKVSRVRLAEEGDYNLSGGRYKAVLDYSRVKWPMVELGEICDFINGRAFKPKDWEKESDSGLPIIRIQNLNNLNADFNYYSGEVKKKDFVKNGDLLFSWSGSRGSSFGPHIWNRGPAILNQHIFNVKHSDQFIRQFLYYVLKKAVTTVEENLHGGVGLVHITKGNLEKIKIPLPPLEVQQEIVEEIEGYQKIIDGARQVVENYQPRIDIDPDWEMVELGEVTTINQESINAEEKFGEQIFTYIDISSVDNNTKKINFDNKVSGIDAPSRARRVVYNDQVLLSTVRPNLRTFAFLENIPNNTIVSTGFAVISPSERLCSKFFYYLLFADIIIDQLIIRMGKGSYPSINQKDVSEIRIPLPQMKIQQQIVEILEKEIELINPSKKLIEIFGQKIEKRIASVWGEEA